MSQGDIGPLPEKVRYAYSMLMDRVFLNLRNNQYADKQERHDLGDALHNVSVMLCDYGSWIDDEGYREIYLRPYDMKWGHKSMHLENFLEEKLNEYLEREKISG